MHDPKMTINTNENSGTRGNRVQPLINHLQQRYCAFTKKYYCIKMHMIAINAFDSCVYVAISCKMLRRVSGCFQS